MDSIEQLLEQFRSGFAESDPERLAGIWDRHHPHLLYIAQELEEPLDTWEDITEYYRRETGRIEAGAVMELHDIRVEVLGDVATAYALAHFAGVVDDEPGETDGRVTFVLHRTDEGWRAIQYHESAPPRP